MDGDGHIQEMFLLLHSLYSLFIIRDISAAVTKEGLREKNTNLCVGTTFGFFESILIYI